MLRGQFWFNSLLALSILTLFAGQQTAKEHDWLQFYTKTPQKTSRTIRPPNRPDYIVQIPVHNQSRNHDRWIEIPSYNTE